MHPDKEKNGPLAENEDFIALIRVAREDSEIRRQLLKILHLDAFHRQSLLNSWIEDLRLKNAPRELIRSLLCLVDDDIAEKAAELIGSW